MLVIETEVAVPIAPLYTFELPAPVVPTCNELCVTPSLPSDHWKSCVQLARVERGAGVTSLGGASTPNVNFCFEPEPTPFEAVMVMG